MAKLYFRYGAMGAAKSMNLIAVAHNYWSRGKAVAVVVPVVDGLDYGVVKSRSGLEVEAIGWEGTSLLKDWQDVDANWLSGYACVLVDEAQFLTAAQVDVLREVTLRGTPVICYGLRTDFQSRLFEGSKRLLELADSIEEVKTVCTYCARKATHNRRTVSGDAQVLVGGDESHEAVCWEHFREGRLEDEDYEGGSVHRYDQNHESGIGECKVCGSDDEFDGNHLGVEAGV